MQRCFRTKSGVNLDESGVNLDESGVNLDEENLYSPVRHGQRNYQLFNLLTKIKIGAYTFFNTLYAFMGSSYKKTLRLKEAS